MRTKIFVDHTSFFVVSASRVAARMKPARANFFGFHGSELTSLVMNFVGVLATEAFVERGIFSSMRLEDGMSFLISRSLARIFFRLACHLMHVREHVHPARSQDAISSRDHAVNIAGEGRHGDPWENTVLLPNWNRVVGGRGDAICLTYCHLNLKQWTKLK